jgi:hypothetical protein
MRHRIAIATIATAAAIGMIVGACADQDGGSRFSTEPGAARPMVSYTTTTSAAVMNPKTKQLEPVRIGSSAQGGPNASVVSGGNAPPLEIPANAPGIAHSAVSTTFTLIDGGGHKQAIVLLYRSTGGPPATMQHYIDGVLVSTTAYQWAKTATGWIRTQSILRSLSKGALVGTYTTTTVPSKPGSGGGPVQTVMNDQKARAGVLERALGGAAYALAFAFAPTDALAQFAFNACQLQYIRFTAAAITVAATAVGVVAAPSPVTFSAFASALANMASAEDVLLDCVLQHGTLASGGGATLPTGKWDCFEGSYSAHCTTAFTM